MNQNLTAKGRKLVAIIDCHFKREPGYFLYDEALANGYIVKTRENKEYEGEAFSKLVCTGEIHSMLSQEKGAIVKICRRK